MACGKWRQVSGDYVTGERTGFSKPVLDRACVPGPEIVTGSLSHEVGGGGVDFFGHGFLDNLHVADDVEIELVTPKRRPLFYCCCLRRRGWRHEMVGGYDR